jgi:hypothetical protein
VKKKKKKKNEKKKKKKMIIQNDEFLGLEFKKIINFNNFYNIYE